MSEQNEACEKSSGDWKNHNSTEITRYFLRNAKKCDCSFLLKSPKSDGSEKVLKSFQWMLRQMSTTLSRILNSESRKANNCKLIPISDPNFETILKFAHTKTLDVDSFDDLICLYESAYNFCIYAFMDAILRKLKVNDEVDIDWMNFFRVAYKTKSYDYKLYTFFNEKLKKMDVAYMERALETEHNLLLKMNAEEFYEFLNHIKMTELKPMICFKALETYVLSNVFDGKDPVAPNLQDNTDRDVVNLFLKNIPFDKMSLNDFQKGPEKAIWIDEKYKNRFLKQISKQCDENIN